MILRGLPIEEYHASAPAWLSKTTINEFRSHGPAWWKLAHLSRTVARKTPGGAAEGLAMDCMLTEGEAAFAARYAVKPKDMSFSTTKGKEWKAEQESRGVKHFIGAEDFDILRDAVDAVRNCSVWPEIQECEAQVTLRRESAALGLGLQSRPDWIDIPRGVVFDLKKTADLSAFGRQAIDLGYHLQAAIAGWCLAGEHIAMERAALVAVEWERGARCRVYEIPDYALDDGLSRLTETAREISARLQSGNWIDRQEQPEPLPIPEWMARKMMAAQ